MKLLWTSPAWEDYVHWRQTDKAIVSKVNELIRDALRNLFTGLGKPEPLKETLKGWWSRRITGEHRLVYRVTGTGDSKQLEIVQCRYHY